MFKYLLTRLLLIIPTVWLISSSVFLIIRLLPGTYADKYVESREGTIGNDPGATNRAAYLKELAAAGLNKPLFYFSFQTQAQPDTLHLVFPRQHQYILQSFISKYGNWPAISAYYQTLVNLQKQVSFVTTAESNAASLQNQTNLLFHTTEPDRINLIFAQLKQRAGGGSQDLQKSVRAAEYSFTQVVKEAKPYQNFLPASRLNGLDNQYHVWLKGIVNTNWGYSLQDSQPVLTVLKTALQNTLLLLISSLLLIFSLSIELSLALSRVKRHRWQKLVLPALYVLESIPLFIIALCLQVFLTGSDYLNLFPVSGLGTEYDEPGNWVFNLGNRFYHLFLPLFCLVIVSVPYVTTQFYQALQQVLESEYITTARSKGLSENKVLRRHAFRNILLPVITLFTGYLPALISGAIIIEVIFDMPGTGRLLSSSVSARDYPVVIGLVLIIATLKAGSHLLADFLYFAADPRTRQKIRS